jgi:glycosyltransferase involved in cell wall biosynthesis
MKILVAAASFSTGMSGIQRHALNLVRCLLLQRDVSSVHMVVAPWQRSMVEAANFNPDGRLHIHMAQMGRGFLGRNVWYSRKLPVLAQSLGIDLVHLTYPVPVTESRYSCPTVVTLHDLYPYEIPMNFGFPKFIFNRAVLRQCLRNVAAIACVSDATRIRLAQYAPFDTWKKSSRIYNCVGPVAEVATKSPIPGWNGEPFLLCVAQHRRNKNIPLLIKAFHRLLRQGGIHRATRLLVIGINGPETARIQHLLIERALSEQVHLLEGLSDGELQWCYTKCETLIAPSATEGFGLPVIEALLAGCKVVCSDIAAFREVGGEHCRFVSLGADEEQSLADAVASTLGQPSQTPVDFPLLSAPVLGKQYVSLYQKLLTSAPLAHSVASSAPLRTTSESGLSP